MWVVERGHCDFVNFGASFEPSSMLPLRSFVGGGVAGGLRVLKFFQPHQTHGLPPRKDMLGLTYDLSNKCSTLYVIKLSVRVDFWVPKGGARTYARAYAGYAGACAGAYADYDEAYATSCLQDV